MFMANDRNDHVYPVFAAHFLQFRSKILFSSFALASKAIIILHYSQLCTNYFYKKT